MWIDSPPAQCWTVELIDGPPVTVWADAVGHADEYYTFQDLVELEEEEQLPDDAVVGGENPTKPAEMSLAVARIPKDIVQLDDGDEDWPLISSEPPRRGLRRLLFLIWEPLWLALPELPAWLQRKRPSELDDRDTLPVHVPAGPPPRWTVTLTNGSSIEIWAEHCTQAEGRYLFTNDVVVEWDGEAPEDLVVIGEVSRGLSHVQLAVASVPEDRVRYFTGGSSSSRSLS